MNSSAHQGESQVNSLDPSVKKPLSKLVTSLLLPWRAVLLIALASLCLVFYIYLNPPHGQAGFFALANLITLPGDLPQYIVRFSSSFVLLGLIPFVFARLFGYKTKEIGLVFTTNFFKSKIFWLLFAILVLSAVISSSNTELNHFYPYSRSLIPLIQTTPYLIIVHALAYSVLYYLPWEILFRGIFIFPFISEALKNQESHLERNPMLFALASLQTLPTVLLHFPHPMVETLAAIPFGLIAAYLVLRFRSILPTLLIHMTVGITLDTIIIFQQARL